MPINSHYESVGWVPQAGYLARQAARDSGRIRSGVAQSSGAAQNRVDAGQVLVCEGQDGECSDVLLNLFHAAGADQCRGDAPISEYPRQSHLRQRLPALSRQLIQSPDLGQLGFVNVALFQKAVRL